MKPKQQRCLKVSGSVTDVEGDDGGDHDVATHTFRNSQKMEKKCDGTPVRAPPTKRMGMQNV